MTRFDNQVLKNNSLILNSDGTQACTKKRFHLGVSDHAITLFQPLGAFQKV